jgi:chemotaxis protein MotB
MAVLKNTRMSIPGLLWAGLLFTLPACVSLDYYDALREAYERSEHRNDAIKAERSSLGRQLDGARLSLAAKDEELDKAHRALAATLQEEIAKGSSTVQRKEHSVNVILAERILYDSGSAEIKSDGTKVLKRIAEALRHSPDTDIRVEGHTDDVPIRTEPRPRFSSNFELSFARAVAVVRYLKEVAKVKPARLSALGLADTRPVLANGSEDARSRNRRVEIIVTQ